jgi:2-phosphosulfolactate phosphatase
VIVDVLSFSTAVEVAVARGARVVPWRWRDATGVQYARAQGALLAGPRGSGYSLSPVSLRALPPGATLVLPSPNGAELSLGRPGVAVLAGCLRNAHAVARAAAALGPRVAVIPAGERWPDDSLRLCFEDQVGAGAILRRLPGSASPEARAAIAAFEAAAGDLEAQLLDCVSGRELAERGYAEDVALAAELDASPCVPRLEGGAYVAFDPG